MITTDQARDLLSRGDTTVVSTTGNRIGEVEGIYLDESTGKPEWASVETDRSGGGLSFVPLAQASVVADKVHVPYDQDEVQGAPRIEQAGEQLTQEQEAQLYAHYGLPYSEAASPSGLPGTGTTARHSAADAPARDDEDAMTRSEERLRVGVAREEVGRARLRKFVVTERQTADVQVAHEEARVVREPITEANRGAATSGPAFSEAVAEVALHAERPVVDKEVVPVERVRLDTATVVDTETVSADVRKEEVELIDPEGRRTDVDPDPTA